VNFSAPLNRDQNLAGLVTFNRQNPQLRVDGSVLRVYPNNLPREMTTEPVELVVSDLLQSSARQALNEEYRQQLVLALVQPGVNFIGADAGILPPATQLSVPFE